ncbi:MAG TPA: methyltransferase domain-containing protein, partial [bacterium]
MYDQRGPQYCAHFGRRLVELAGVGSGSTVLDIATGRGAVLFPAAERAGAAGRVEGIDLADEMVRETAAEIAARRIDNALVRVMDAERLVHDDGSFDHVLCGFGLFYFPHLDHALVEFHRVLKTGGTIAASTWRGDSGWGSWYDELLAQYVEPVRLGSHDLSTPERLEQALRSAGFTAVRVVADEAEFIYTTEQEWWDTLWGHGTRASLERMAPAELPRFQRQAFDRIRAEREADGFHVTFRVLYGLGVKRA